MIPRDDLPFLPKINWKFWLPVLAVVAAFPVVWMRQRDAEAQRLRAALLREHATLTATLAPQYRQRRDALERHVLEATGAYQGDLRAPGFTVSDLTREPALYARVRVPEVRDRSRVMASVRHRYPDQLPSCLGLETVPAREVMDRGAFLLPSFVASVRDAPGVERLNALRSDMLFRLRRDTELLVDGTRRRYLVVVSDEARASTEGPTRVYAWDLTTDQPVLRARSEGGEVLIVPFRVHGVPSAPPSRNPIGPRSVSAHDCSVADAARRVLGEAPPAVAHAPEPTANGSTDAAADADVDAAQTSPSP